MKKIKVYLQYPWGISDSQYYKSLIENPPKSVEYVSSKVKLGMIHNKKLFAVKNFLKGFIRNFLLKIRFSPLNIKRTKTKKGYDLIHCAHCLSKNNSPWVVDFEGDAWQIWLSGVASKRSHRKAKKILLRKNCKKIIAWTESSKKEIIKRFPEIEKKIEIVSYAMPFPKQLKKKKKNKITLLFIGRYFYSKGGLHALKVFDKLTKKYENVEGIFISQIPKEIYERYKGNKKIKFFGLMPHEKVMGEIFPQSDIFVYPGYGDTFGFMFLEAMSFGLPVVTVDGFARKDLVEEGKTGFIINRPWEINTRIIGPKEEQLIDEIIKKTEELIENKKLHEKMSKNSIEMIKKGGFSIEERNKKLEKVYREALK